MDPAAIGTFINQFGLPVAILIGEAVLVLRGIIVVKSGAQEKREAEAAVREREFQEKLRLEEREGRLKAEHQLQRVVETVAPALEGIKALLGTLEKEVIRGHKRNGA